MGSRTEDPFAREYRRAQVKRDLDRALRGVQLCTSCDAEFRDDVSGRYRHRLLFGHPASRAPREAS